MKKKVKGLFVALLMLFSSVAFAEDFDWSQCWCNYGAGIKSGTIIADVTVGMNDTIVYYMNYPDSYWMKQTRTGSFILPYIDATFDVALPIWKLPLSWGAYCGTNMAFGKSSYVNFAGFYMTVGGQVKYHVMLPVENLDVYAGMRLGFTFGADKQTINIPSYNINEERVRTDRIGIYGGGFIGAAYYFTQGFGVTAEFGFPVWVKAGVSIKIK